MKTVEYQVWQDGLMVASAYGHDTDARREALHYAAVYGQDGPVEVERVSKGKRERIDLRSNAVVSGRRSGAQG